MYHYLALAALTWDEFEGCSRSDSVPDAALLVAGFRDESVTAAFFASNRCFATVCIQQQIKEVN